MHDVHRDSLIYKKERKRKAPSNRERQEALGNDHEPAIHGQAQDHDHGEAHGHKPGVPDHDHGHDHDYDHDHDHDEAPVHSHEDADHDHNHGHDHDHAVPHGHTHDHDENDYEDHDHDLHTHGHNRDEHKHYEDRAYHHVHEHAHSFSHAHHHSHHPEHTSLVHRIFRDPVRDWFGAALMALLILTGSMQWLPGHLSEGMMVCAAVIGIFPLLKNAVFDCVARRKLSIELFVGGGLALGLFSGRFLLTALIAFFLVLGSFMKLNFSWRDE